MEAYWLIGGLAAGILATNIVGLLRRAYIRRKMKRMFGNAPVLRKFQKDAAHPLPEKPAAHERRPGNDTKKRIHEKRVLEERESKVEEMLNEMRELILHLTEILAETNTVSGEASSRFAEARNVLANLDLDSDVDIGQVRIVLMTEIGRMVQSNSMLRKQLKVAQSGMTNQKLEIDKLRTKAHVDTLTQLLNRAAFDDVLEKVFTNWKHFQDVFSLLMLDIDHFKKVNDTYGHLHGDRILKEIAAKIKEGIRDHDYAARYGGEEFAVILSNTPAEEALLVGTRIRENIERSIFQMDGKQIWITISGGIAQSRFGWNPTEIISAADKALYQSKHRGRNRITLAEDRIKDAWTSGEGK